MGHARREMLAPDLATTEHKGDALVTLRTIIAGVVRAEDLQASPPLPRSSITNQVIDIVHVITIALLPIQQSNRPSIASLIGKTVRGKGSLQSGRGWWGNGMQLDELKRRTAERIARNSPRSTLGACVGARIIIPRVCAPPQHLSQLVRI